MGKIAFVSKLVYSKKIGECKPLKCPKIWQKSDSGYN